jgi:hypothetical protein
MTRSEFENNNENTASRTIICLLVCAGVAAINLQFGLILAALFAGGFLLKKAGHHLTAGLSAQV